MRDVAKYGSLPRTVVVQHEWDEGISIRAHCSIILRQHSCSSELEFPLDVKHAAIGAEHKESAKPSTPTWATGPT